MALRDTHLAPIFRAKKQSSILIQLLKRRRNDPRKADLAWSYSIVTVHAAESVSAAHRLGQHGRSQASAESAMELGRGEKSLRLPGERSFGRHRWQSRGSYCAKLEGSGVRFPLFRSYPSPIYDLRDKTLNPLVFNVGSVEC